MPELGVASSRTAVKEALAVTLPVFETVNRTMQLWISTDELCTSPS